MATSISQSAIYEFTNFLSNFAQPETVNHKPTRSLSYDEAKNSFYENMRERRLAEEAFWFYGHRLNAFAKYLTFIKKKNAINEVSEAEIKHY